MIQYYCKKCGLESSSQICSQCHKKLPANTLRDVWQVYHVPLSDKGIWLGIFQIIAVIVLLLFLLLFGAEFFMTGAAQVVYLFSTNLPACILSVIPVTLIISFIVLLIQGREIQMFVVDVQGAHMQTWHDASKVKCWARHQSGRMLQVLEQEDGQAITLSQVQHILWKDVRQVRYNEKKKEIRLYHTRCLSPMILRLPPDEYETCENIVKSHCKNLA